MMVGGVGSLSNMNGESHALGKISKLKSSR
jgi:hypothetical protein